MIEPPHMVTKSKVDKKNVIVIESSMINYQNN